MLHTHIVLQKRIHVSALVSSSLLLVLSILAFFPVASSFSDTLAAPVQSETTLSMTAENINLNLSVDNPNGTFNASDPASLTVATNNYTGYTLSILASTSGNDATKLVNGENSITSISTASSANDFNNGNWGILPSKVNSAVNSSYIPAPTFEGTTLDATNSANADANSYTIALGAKADYTLPAGKYSNTFVITAVANPVGYSISYSKNTEDEVSNMPASQTGDLGDTDITVSANIPTRIGYTFNNWCDDTVTSTNGVDACSGNVYEPGDIFATSMQTTNSLTLVAMWNRTFTLNFDANGGTGTMSSQTITGTSANIDENTFTRDGYNFAGWNTLANGTGTAYTSGAVYTVPATGTSDTLYAQWEASNLIESAMAAANKTKITANDGNDYYQMQDMSDAICSAVTTPTAADYSDTPEAKLVDNRDGKVYWVAKLMDGKCWMTQNLDFDLDSTKTYTNDDTDLGWNGTTYTTASWKPDNSTIDASGNSFTGFGNDNIYPYSIDVGDWYWTDTWYYAAAYDYLANGANDKFKTTPFSGNGEHGHLGNYYTWTAAIAMNDSSSLTASTYNNIENNPQTSICPRGWRLPTLYNSNTDSRNEFKYLLDQYGAYTELDQNADPATAEEDRKATGDPLYFIRTGRATRVGIRVAGVTGRYISSTVGGLYDNDYMWERGYYFNVTPGGFYNDTQMAGPSAYSIRCVAR